MEETYTFDGEEVTDLWESMDGSYWVITNESPSPSAKYGYACLSGMRQFAEWGLISASIIERPTVWSVPPENWTISGPDSISIEKE